MSTQPRPQNWDNAWHVGPPEFITRERFIELSGWSRSHFFSLCKSGRIAVNNVDGQKLFAVASLPPAAQKRFRNSLPAPGPELIDEAPLFAMVPKPLRVVEIDAAPKVALTVSDEEHQALTRLEIIRPMLEYPADPGRFHSLKLTDGSCVRTIKSLAQYLADQHGLSLRTVLNYYSRFKNEGGLAQLADRRRSDKGKARWAAQSEQHAELAELAAYAYLKEKPGSKRFAWEVVVRRAAALGIEPPSYETLRTYLDKLHPAMVTLSLQGRRAYDEMFAPYIKRGYTDVAANEIWVSDHMIHDVLVQNDCFGSRDRQHMRVRFTALLDFRARYVTGKAWSEEGSSRSITTAMRHAITAHGAPRMFYCDNGKDYQKVAKGAHREEFEQGQYLVQDLAQLSDTGIMHRLGIEVQHCIKFHPQSKHVERFFNTMHERFDKLFVTYTGPTPEKRPDRCIAALERHKKLLAAGRPEDSDLPLASEFIQLAMNWIDLEYHHLPQQGNGMDGRTPAEVFNAERWTGQRPKPGVETLALMLTDRVKRKVSECAIRLNGQRFMAPPNSVWSANMHSATGSEVLVCFDPVDTDCAAALDLDGNLIAYLEPEKLLRQSNDAETRELIGASMAERKRLYRGVQDSLDALSRRVHQRGHVSAEETMRQRAALPAAVGDHITERPLRMRELRGDDTATAPASAADIAASFLEALK